MIYITGDTHGDIDISKLNMKNFPHQKDLTKQDYVIILGDFGLVWDNSAQELYWQEWLNDKPWTTLFIDGNHDNHPLIWSYPLVPMFGDMVCQISDSIFYLQRGHVYDIEGNSFLALGGAESIDKEYRIPDVSWWATESIRPGDYELALRNVIERGGVDYILTHAAPRSAESVMSTYIYPTQSSRYLENLLYRVPSFKAWFFGHYHVDQPVYLNDITSKDGEVCVLRAVYNDIIEIFQKSF